MSKSRKIPDAALPADLNSFQRSPKFYRNIDEVTSDQGGLIDPGALWELNNYNFFILQDDDEYHCTQFNDLLFEKVDID